MKRLLTGNAREGDKRYDHKKVELFLKAQIDNSLELFWKPDDIILITNFDFAFMGVEAIKIELNDFCRTGSKMFAVQWYFDNFDTDETVWSADLDCWQNIYFDELDLNVDIEGNEFFWNRYDVGATFYSRPKFNGGGVFWKKSAKDIIDIIVSRISGANADKEEPTINSVFKSDEYSGRVAVLNNTFNVGCSGFTKRYERSVKPIKVCHFHPLNRIAWETHALDRNGQDYRSVSPRLEQLLRSYYPSLATMLRPDGKKKADDIRKKRMEEGIT